MTKLQLCDAFHKPIHKVYTKILANKRFMLDWEVMPLNQKDFQVVPEKPLIQGGFTLLELMITVSLAAILMAIAIPSFTETIKNNRITAQVNGFVSALNFTRSEAIKRGVRVSMCKSSDTVTCMKDGAGSNWSQGWIIFTNQDNDGVFDGGGEAVLKIQDGTQNQTTIVGNSLVDDMISYLPNGLISAVGGTITVCDDRVGDVGKEIKLNSVGRSKINSGVSCP
jgi:type IV fimbrial biogenesis protein FimT